jgi:hypothetical protein
MHRFNVRIPRKIGIIEGQDLLDSMHAHDGYQPCIVDLNPTDIVGHDEAPPFAMYSQAVGQQQQFSSNSFARRSVS